MRIKKLFLVMAVGMMAACGKENRTFRLKTIRLNDYRHQNPTDQKRYLKVFGDNGQGAIAETGFYPAGQTLPATFGIHPSIPMTLYHKSYRVPLWGDVSGLIGTCSVDMGEYKIIFPIDMEVKNDSLSISITGSWE
ncbi:hypothetical protein [Chitinophaga caseinilytica]|uniref:Uncharacterized protein n=1 Tax=Chitinophaga caseinilytica TaxID=2267521 RepID=A0ABZ2YZ63_9BACT